MLPPMLKPIGEMQELECSVYRWRINGSICTGTYSRSPKFRAVGHNWCLLAEQLKNSVSIVPLLMNDVMEDFTVVFELIPVDPSRAGTEMRHGGITIKHSFRAGCKQRGFGPGILGSADVVNKDGDAGVLLCRIWKDELSAIPKARPSGITDSFAKLLESKEMADVEFLVDDTAFNAHKVVLAAQSPVFKAQLYGSFAESSMKTIRITEMKPIVFQALLHFAYTENMLNDEVLFGNKEGGGNVSSENNISIVQEILAAAEKYELEGLKLLCEENLLKSVTVDTVCSLTVTAERHNCMLLKDRCFSFMLNPKYSTKVMLSDAYVQLFQSCPPLLDQLRLMNAKQCAIPRT